MGASPNEASTMYHQDDMAFSISIPDLVMYGKGIPTTANVGITSATQIWRLNVTA